MEYNQSYDQYAIYDYMTIILYASHMQYDCILHL